MRPADALLNVRLLGIDTAPFIYFIEQNPAYSKIIWKIFRFLAEGKLTGLSSVITLTEVLINPLRAGNQQLAREYRDLLLNGTNFTLVPVDAYIAAAAPEIRAKYNLRVPHAIPMTAAIESGCDAFLCNDKTLRRVSQISVLVLDEISLSDSE